MSVNFKVKFCNCRYEKVGTEARLQHQVWRPLAEADYHQIISNRNYRPRQTSFTTFKVFYTLFLRNWSYKCKVVKKLVKESRYNWKFNSITRICESQIQLLQSAFFNNNFFLIFSKCIEQNLKTRRLVLYNYNTLHIKNQLLIIYKFKILYLR